MTLTRLSWREYNGLARNLITDLNENNFQPEVIVGIARGGLPLLATMASALGIREVGVVFMQNTLTDKAFSTRPPRAVCKGVGIPFPVKSRRVLLVDDIIRSGQSVQQSIESLEHLGAKAIKVVTLYKEEAIYPFDHYATKLIEKDAWVVFPWDDLS